MNFPLVSSGKYYLWVGLSLILIFTMLEPAATQDSRLLGRFFIWSLQIGLLLPMLIGLLILLQSINPFNHLNPWLKLILSGLIGSALFVPVGLAIDYLFNLDDWSGVNHLKDTLPLVYKEFGGIFFPAALTWIAINAPRILQLSFNDSNAAPAAARSALQDRPTPISPNDFCSLVPREIGNDIF
jgi:hypothetical protein